MFGNIIKLCLVTTDERLTTSISELASEALRKVSPDHELCLKAVQSLGKLKKYARQTRYDVVLIDISSQLKGKFFIQNEILSVLEEFSLNEEVSEPLLVPILKVAEDYHTYSDKIKKHCAFVLERDQLSFQVLSGLLLCVSKQKRIAARIASEKTKEILGKKFAQCSLEALRARDARRIMDALKGVRDSCHLELCELYRFKQSESEFKTIASSDAKEHASSGIFGSEWSKNQFPWLFENLRAGKTVEIKSSNYFVPRARHELEVVRSNHLGELYAYPIFDNDSLIGAFIGGKSVHAEGFKSHVYGESDLTQIFESLHDLAREFIELCDMQDLCSQEVKVLRESVSKAKDKFRSVLESIDLGVCIEDLNGRVVFANKSYASIVEKDLTSILGRYSADAKNAHIERILGEQATSYKLPLDGLADQKPNCRKPHASEDLTECRSYVEKLFMSNGQVKVLEVNSSSVSNTKGKDKGIVRIFRDVTDREITYQELEKARCFNKYSKVSVAMLASMAEANTALNAYVSSMMGSNDRHESDLFAFERMNTLLRDESKNLEYLLSVGGAPEVEMKVINLNEEISAVVERCDNSVLKSGRICTELYKEELPVEVSISRLRQLLLSVVFTQSAQNEIGERGDIFIRTGRFEQSDRKVVSTNRLNAGTYVAFVCGSSSVSLEDLANGGVLNPFLFEGEGSNFESELFRLQKTVQSMGGVICCKYNQAKRMEIGVFLPAYKGGVNNSVVKGLGIAKKNWNVFSKDVQAIKCAKVLMFGGGNANASYYSLVNLLREAGFKAEVVCSIESCLRSLEKSKPDLLVVENRLFEESLNGRVDPLVDRLKDLSLLYLCSPTQSVVNSRQDFPFKERECLRFPFFPEDFIVRVQRLVGQNRTDYDWPDLLLENSGF